jgi:CelD/BcsL family acetyltransferase involved in cellulose biosynthesis
MVLDEAADRCGIVWREDGSVERAAIRPKELPEDYLRRLYSGARRREIQRRFRRLASYGRVRFDLIRSGADHRERTKRFLALEGMGWKGEQDTALISIPGHASFVEEMVAGLSAAGRVLFGELRAGDVPVASTLNLLASETVFALKVGWNPDFAKYSPGVLCQVKLMEALPEVDGVELVDSCAVPGSWLEKVWPWQRRLTTGVFPTSGVGNVLTASTLQIKRVKRRLWGEA